MFLDNHVKGNVLFQAALLDALEKSLEALKEPERVIHRFSQKAYGKCQIKQDNNSIGLVWDDKRRWKTKALKR